MNTERIVAAATISYAITMVFGIAVTVLVGGPLGSLTGIAITGAGYLAIYTTARQKLR